MGNASGEGQPGGMTRREGLAGRGLEVVIFEIPSDPSLVWFCKRAQLCVCLGSDLNPDLLAQEEEEFGKNTDPRL